ncbi:hypothetical protein [Gordonia aichiensis]|uniref:DUF5134 domain-containing protein n=1 Tax=Gordonia aichiensis NBRC 108223 TaxID=1220583 RepID=L7KS15_9ACTN|nr:hypothetical protein [Gordonia aichiensis]GAC50752.1 hypothetical protein GOACH_29_00400 [Gordonia aichiensis NBRC 108223]
MHTILIIGALVPMAVGLGCCGLDRSRIDAIDTLVMAVMLVGMTDIMVFDHHLLPVAGWIAVFAGSVVATLTRSSRSRLTVVRAITIMVMAVLTAAMSATMSSTSAAAGNHTMASGTSASMDMGLSRHTSMSTDVTSAAGHGLSSWALAALVVAIGAAAYATREIIRTPRLLPRLELGASIVSVVAMATMLIL